MEVFSGLVKMAFDGSNGLWWMLLLKRLEGETGKLGNMPMVQSFFEHGEAWAKESGICKSNQVSGRSMTNGSVGMMSGRQADVEFPQLVSGVWWPYRMTAL